MELSPASIQVCGTSGSHGELAANLHIRAVTRRGERGGRFPAMATFPPIVALSPIESEVA